MWDSNAWDHQAPLINDRWSFGIGHVLVRQSTSTIQPLNQSFFLPFYRFTLNIIEQSTSSSIDKKRSTCAMDTLQPNLKSNSIWVSYFFLSFVLLIFHSFLVHITCVCFYCGQMLSCWTFVVVQMQFFSLFHSLLPFLLIFVFVRIRTNICMHSWHQHFVICVSFSIELLFGSSVFFLYYYFLSFWN